LATKLRICEISLDRFKPSAGATTPSSASIVAFSLGPFCRRNYVCRMEDPIGCSESGRIHGSNPCVRNIQNRLSKLGDADVGADIKQGEHGDKLMDLKKQQTARKIACLQRNSSVLRLKNVKKVGNILNKRSSCNIGT
ncbi:unnamed protein product, partial [Arabidopsis halleri]